jgi:pimeloyl-ACP methyl ester carboxylesterase
MIVKGLLSLGLVFVLLLGAGLIYRAWLLRQSEEALKIPGPAGIDEAMFIEVGGTWQWVTIRGRDRANPVVLMIHGGPGASNGAFSVELLPSENEFTIVQWDQPGTAKSFARAGGRIEADLTIDGVAEEGIQVAEFLKTHLHKEKMILLGWSWGSIIGVEMARKRPGLFAAYVGTGQIVNEQAGEAISYAKVLASERARGDRQAVKELEAGPPPYKKLADVGNQRKWSSIYAGDPSPAMQLIKFALLTPRYSLGDAWSYVSGFMASQNHFLGPNMEGEFMKVDLTAGNMAFALPVFIIQGAEDVWTPAELSRAFVERLTAPEKAFIPIDGAGHTALVRNTSAFLKVMRERVRPILSPVPARVRE